MPGHIPEKTQPDTMLPTTSEEDVTPDPQTRIDRLLADPSTADAVRGIQRDARAMLDDQTDALVLALGRVEPAARIAQTRVPMNVRDIASTCRQANELVSGRRKFVRDILIATLINRDNEDWDMTDASTWRTDPDDLLLALMKMPPL